MAESPHFTSDPLYGEFARARDLLATNQEKALQIISDLAQNGSPVSMVFVADGMLFGQIYERNIDDAAGWYRLAASAGVIHGNHGLGRIHWERGEFDQAKEQFELGLSKNFGPSINLLGLMYFQGRGVGRNLAKARELWELAWDLGHLWALKNLVRQGTRGTFGLAAVPQALFRLLVLTRKFGLESGPSPKVAAEGAWTIDALRL